MFVLAWCARICIVFEVCGAVDPQLYYNMYLISHIRTWLCLKQDCLYIFHSCTRFRSLTHLHSWNLFPLIFDIPFEIHGTYFSSHFNISFFSSSLFCFSSRFRSSFCSPNLPTPWTSSYDSMDCCGMNRLKWLTMNGSNNLSFSRGGVGALPFSLHRTSVRIIQYWLSTTPTTTTTTMRWSGEGEGGVEK